MTYQALKGKCKEYIEKGLCFGCMRCELPEFEGDDNCIYIKEREAYEQRHEDWRIK